MTSLFVQDEDGLEEQQSELLHQQNQDFAIESRSTSSQSQSQSQSHTPTQQLESSIPVVFHDEGTIPIYPHREVNCSLLLKYQQEILEEMLVKDALLVLGRGLGWESITGNLLYSLSSPFIQLSKTQKKKSLIFLLNAKDSEIIRLSEELDDLSWINDDIGNRFVTVSGESQSSKRKLIYSEGGIISITPRVLVVDILSGILDVNDITGLFVLHAERIKETSNDAFIISLFRDKNEWGFVKAFSDEPESFTGFTPLATKLKILRVANVSLWPRFHVTVTQSFQYYTKKNSKRFVTEINTQMSYKMNKIQAALLSCIQACLGELKRHNPTLATEYWDMENIHDPNFVRVIRVSLDPQWHRLTYTTKQLINDLVILLELLESLVALDSVSFYQVVKNIVDVNLKQTVVGMNRSMSPWLNLDESQTVIQYAKERALGKYNGEYILEELPKWNQLGILIDDILNEKSQNNSENSGRVLIMCSSRKVAAQLNQVLTTMKEKKSGANKHFSSRSFMTNRLRDYLQYKEISALVKKISHELEHAGEENDGASEDTEIAVSKTFSRNGQPVSKRRRTRGASVVARVHQLHTGGNFGDNENDDEKENENIMDLLAEDKDEGVEEKDGIEESLSGDIVASEELNFDWIKSNDQILVQVYNDKHDASFLEELSPSHIIMYEPDLSFIRRIEIYQAMKADNPAKVYFMYYGNSVEEQKHLLRIKKEKDAFTRLIREKANLSKHFETADDNVKFQTHKSQVVNTRIAGGAKFRTEQDEMRVVVDVREFGSSLPNLLYKIGIQVVPCMITVGDYIVSPQICIERKSIPDLIGSFKSGRLYNQCEQMFKYYDLPVLLIEFDENKSFSLESFSESKFIKTKANLSKSTASLDNKLRQNLQSQIFSLLYSFPKLKIIWSSSPYETAQIFLELKANQDEPDVGMALDKGANRNLLTQGGGANDGGPAILNDDPIDFIRSVPGINNSNIYKIVKRVENITELVKLSQDELIDILGVENGRKAYNFFNRTV
ncbi:Rad1 single-stranded DNA endonuclease [Candida orthopsilosis Co 90-125]|uniref:Rad1 single-stranded DNA endonuclease n=1 Tax=Candida orthopsilosis (strain 90-125) TaxID=1136231 RepID=H8X3U5_CANO9|nr:Rad1 single-stranded DNA endonuclease [Candida orthopsilosis Co 90-125]CCG25733.1 Rad1 single-stranded DNA endonuclease [Candida orthopsilosis Co 90-125]